MRQLIAILSAAALIACGARDHGNGRDASAATAGRTVDAKTVPAALEPPPASPVVQPVLNKSRRWLRDRKPLVPHGGALRATGKADARVIACGQDASNWDEMRGCLDRLTIAPPELDAGARRRLGAVRPPPINPAWAVPDWWITPGTGNDGNTCVDAAHPCKTFAEIVARWGGTDEPFVTDVVTLHLAGTFPVTDYVHWHPTVTNTGAAVIECVPSAIASATISSLAAKDHTATGAYPAGLLRANLGASQATGLQLVNVTHPSTAWIDKVVSTTSVITQPMDANSGTWNATAPEVDTWANGDAVVLQQPAQIYLSRFEIVSAGSGLYPTSDFVGGFLGGCWVKDPTTTVFPSLVNIGRLLEVTETRLDPSVAMSGESAIGVIGTFVNDYMPFGGTLSGAVVYGGSIGGSVSSGGSLEIAGGLDADVIVHGDTNVEDGSSVGLPGTVFGAIYWDQATVLLNGAGITTVENYPTAANYGNYTYALDDLIAWAYSRPVSATFMGSPKTGEPSRLEMFTAAFANAYDPSVTPAQWYPARALDWPALDVSIASGGFGGMAFADYGAVVTVDLQQSSSAPTPFFQSGAGISLSGGTPGSPLTISSTVTGGVSSVSGSGSVSCSPTTGAVVCTGSSAVTSVIGSGLVFCSPTSGSVVCSATSPVAVANGGTGDTSLTAHGVLLGEGTSAVAVVSPGAAGVPLVSSGASTDPIYGIATVAGGGTGQSSLTGNSLVVGNGTSPVLLIAPGSSGTVLQSNGTTWNAAANPAIQGFYSSGTATALSGTTFVTLATSSITTPNDGITHAWRAHVDCFLVNTNAVTTWTATLGPSIDSTSAVIAPFTQVFLVPAGSGLQQAVAASVTDTVSLSPNTAHTFRALVKLDNTGGTGINVSCTLDGAILS